jgi:S1-C subfamily serine protease
MTDRSDAAPALTYVAQVVAQSPELDLDVPRVVAGLDGRPVTNLHLKAVALGESDALELGDSVRIFGYLGIGGETVTLTSGTVSGFSHARGVKDRRAWVKTDATIAGALVIALKPGVKVSEFIQRKQRDITFTSVQTDSNGAFTLPQQLPKGPAYGLVVVARGYRDLAIESGLRVPANAPERAQVNPITLQPE